MHQISKHVQRALLFITALYSLLSTSSQAQGYVDIITISAQTTPETDFDTGLDDSTQINALNLQLTLPIELNEKVALVTGYSGAAYQLKLNPFADKTTLMSHLLKLGLNIRLSDALSGTFLALPKVAATSEDVFADDAFQLGGLVLFKQKKHQNLLYKYGLYYNGERFGPFFVPLLGLYLKKGPYTVDLTLPVRADVGYTLTDGLSIGLNFVATVRTYGAPTNTPFLGNSYIHQSSNDVSLYAALQMDNGLRVVASLGHSVARYYRRYANQDQINFGISAFKFGDDRVQFNVDTADSLFFNLAFTYRYFIDEASS